MGQDYGKGSDGDWHCNYCDFHTRIRFKMVEHIRGQHPKLIKGKYGMGRGDI